jgi:hypothetical protein
MFAVAIERPAALSRAVALMPPLARIGALPGRNKPHVHQSLTTRLLALSAQNLVAVRENRSLRQEPANQF